MKVNWAGCFGKIPYKTHGEASRVVKRMVRRRHLRKWEIKSRMVAYQCRYCGHYHVGNDVKEGSRGYQG